MIIYRMTLTPLIFLGIFLSSPLGEEAKAACFNEPLDGTWVNPDAITKDLVKLHIVHECTQEETKDGLIIPGSRWYVRAWAKCYPANCAWGRVQARIGPKGNLRASLPTYAADRFLSMKTEGEGIRVKLTVNYHDPRRKDRKETVRLIKR